MNIWRAVWPQTNPKLPANWPSIDPANGGNILEAAAAVLAGTKV
jgi:hypothetical protein